MSFAAALLPEYEHEMASTRQVLERVPNDKLTWKAHPKSNSIGWVAAHLAEIPGWVAGTLTQESWDLNPPGGVPYQSPRAESREQLLAIFDQNVAAGKQAIAATRDADFLKSWSLLNAGQPMLTLPRIGVIRTWVLNHIIHHRAHLIVYLRLNDISVPGMYGPGADDGG